MHRTCNPQARGDWIDKPRLSKAQHMGHPPSLVCRRFDSKKRSARVIAGDQWSLIGYTSNAVLDETSARNDLDGRCACSRRCQCPNDRPGQFRSGGGHSHAIEWSCRNSLARNGSVRNGKTSNVSIIARFQSTNAGPRRAPIAANTSQRIDISVAGKSSIGLGGMRLSSLSNRGAHARLSSTS